MQVNLVSSSVGWLHLRKDIVEDFIEAQGIVQDRSRENWWWRHVRRRTCREEWLAKCRFEERLTKIHRPPIVGPVEPFECRLCSRTASSLHQMQCHVRYAHPDFRERVNCAIMVAHGRKKDSKEVQGPRPPWWEEPRQR